MKRRWLAAASLALAAVARGQEPAVPPEVVKARQAVHELEECLKQLEQRQAGLGHEREKLDLEMNVAALRVRESETESKAAEAAVAVAARAAQSSQAELTKAMEHLRLQLTLLAVLGRAGLAPLILNAIGSEGDLPRRVTVALAVFADQKRRRDESAALMEQRAAALAALSRRREDLAGALRSVAERRQELERTRERVVGQLAALERERRAGAMALAGAREDEERLERLWGVVTQAGAADAGDARLLRGGLRWPVGSQHVLQGFGAQRDPRYGTLTVSHGVVLGASAGELVVAIAGGKVSYAQFFKGYGNLVIVHHGGEIYSLYARLASMLVRAGQRVGTGEPLGIVGRDEAGTGSVYLEIRVGQNPQDPLSWLKPMGK